MRKCIPDLILCKFQVMQGKKRFNIAAEFTSQVSKMSMEQTYRQWKSLTEPYLPVQKNLEVMQIDPRLWMGVHND